jgi:hypothetical protein
MFPATPTPDVALIHRSGLEPLTLRENCTTASFNLASCYIQHYLLGTAA